MPSSSQQERQFDRVILLFLLALFLLVSPFINWWAAADSPWFAPYLIWALLIAAMAWLQRRRRRHDQHDV